MILNLQGGYLDDIILYRTDPRRLQIEHHIIVHIFTEPFSAAAIVLFPFRISDILSSVPDFMFCSWFHVLFLVLFSAIIPDFDRDFHSKLYFFRFNLEKSNTSPLHTRDPSAPEKDARSISPSSK